MRIAIVVEHVNRRGGQDRVVAELAERLSRWHEVHLFCFSAEPLRGERLTVHPLWCPFRSSTLQGFWILLASSIALREGHFDATISQGGNCLDQDSVLMHTCHAIRAERTREVEWQYDPPNPLRRIFQQFRSWAFLALEGRAVRRCPGAVMTVSRYLKDYTVAQHGLAEDDVHVTENGVDHDTFHPGLRARHKESIRTDLGIPQDAFLVAFVGGRWFDKGVPFLIEALAAMRDKRAHLMVVGDGDVGFFSRFAETHGVGERVRFAPPTNRPERFYAAADCFGFPSDAEAFGLVAAEAAACGLPLVTTNVGAAEYLVEEGVTGFIVPQDTAVIAEKLDLLAADAALLADMSRAVQHKSLGLSWDKQADKVMAVLEGNAR